MAFRDVMRLAVLALLVVVPANAWAQVQPKIVQLNFHGWMVERKSRYDLFAKEKFSLHTLRRQIAKAAADPSVAALILRFGEVSIGFSQAEDLAQALLRFRATGKKVYAYLDSAGNVAYWLAAHADQVVMPPSGYLHITGLRLEAWFLKDLLGKIGVEADFESTGKYKSAADGLTRSTMSAGQREALNALLDDLYARLVGGIAKARKLSRDKVKGLIDKALLVAKEARTHKLVDRLQYWTEFKDAVLKRHRGLLVKKYKAKEVKLPTSIFSLFSFLTDKPQSVSGPHIAVLYASGTIVYGTGDDDWSGSSGIGSFRFQQYLQAIEQNDNVKALVLRVDSPGGSALASDLIWRALRRLKKRMPIIVSMGNVAASGGYYIALPGDVIVAQPTTITGSIGVIGGKLIIKGMLQKVGINPVVMTRGKGANIFGSDSRFDIWERRRFRRFIDDTYADFLGKVAKSRKISLQRAKQLAGGRIWSGAQAKKNGLVDRLGGLDLAIRIARKRAKLSADVPAVAYPRARSFLEYLRQSIAPAMWSPLKVIARELGASVPFLGTVRQFAKSLGTEPVLLVSPMLFRLR